MKHDDGTTTIILKDNSLSKAINRCLEVEVAPESAITNIKIETNV